jgi:ankyrin repeat protein
MPRGRVPATRSRATSTEDISVVEHLIKHGADIEAQDQYGNTCLHYATAWGNLKAIRALMQAGAVPVSTNRAGWTPDNYSLTVQAEVYYKAMINEWERRLDEESVRENERRAQQGGRSVRLVAAEDSDDLASEHSRDRADSERSHNTARSGSDTGLGISVGKVDTWM